MSENLGTFCDTFDKFNLTARECFDLVRRERAARLKAEKDNLQKEAFLAIAAHELRNPLHSINGWLQILSSERLGEPATRQAIEAIRRSIRQQARIVEDLLDISSILNGKFRLNLCPTELATMINEIVGDFQTVSQAKGIVIETSLRKSLGIFTIDSARFEQVLRNLLSNAVKFSPPNTKIRITARRCKSFFELSVIDKGRGIEPEFLRQIFKPFTQINISSGERQNGLGLGLSIVRSIVELHGGSIEAESAGCGQGTKFTVRLPFEESRSAEN